MGAWFCGVWLSAIFGSLVTKRSFCLNITTAILRVSRVADGLYALPTVTSISQRHDIPYL